MPRIFTWLVDSLHRVYPSSPPETRPSIRISVPRGGFAAFQLCVRCDDPAAASVAVDVEAPDGVASRVRRVGYVPVRGHSTETPPEELDGVGRIPGLVPDPLLPEATAVVGPYATQSFWITLRAARDARPGRSAVRVRVRLGEEKGLPLEAELEVSPIEVSGLTGFPVTHWFYADALCDWYKVRPFTPAFWPIAEAYMRNYAEHLGTCQYVPFFTPPTDGVKRPTQLLRVHVVGPNAYRFDFRDVRCWVRAASRAGAQYFEWTHFFSQWGVAHALRVYRSNSDPTSLLWPPDTAAMSPIYRAFLAQLLPELRLFLQKEGILERSFFHVSDEPGLQHLEAYRAAREMLRELAPWMRVSDALSELEFGKLGLTDIPIPSIATARQYAEAGIPAWVYFCCGPRGRYVNRLLDTPLVKIRTMGALMHRFRAQGFLHWGYNYWYQSQTQDLIDPYAEQAGGVWPGWPPGDPFVVYPGPAGPVDSIRWEVWAEGLQDLATLRVLGVDPDDPRLEHLRGYDDFPRDAAWIERLMNGLLAGDSATGRTKPNA